MILENVIGKVVEQQKERIISRDSGLKRELIPGLGSLSSHALIISGIRRCGKSTFLLQIMKEMDDERLLYLNFESPRLHEFTLNDFARLDRIIGQKKADTLFFDELQLVAGWEMYVRQKLDEKYRVIITGSNASMLSNELGTKLTGRHITRELFPFSYNEFLAFRSLTPSAESLQDYLDTGGFPEFIKSGDPEQLATLYDDILIRDIVARHGIKDMKSLQRLAAFLYSNTGNRITAGKLRQPLSIGATTTVLSWFSFLEDSYLVFFVPMFSHSVKAQLINPRKVYAIDPGLVNVLSTAMTPDYGRRLENIIYLHLRRKYDEIYYFDNKGECDFITMTQGSVAELVQVCHELTPDNLDREVNGLLAAMQFFDHQKAIIVTHNQTDFIKKDGFEIKILPAWEFLGK